MAEINPVNQGLLTIHKIITRALKNALVKCRDFSDDDPAGRQGLFLYVTALRNIIHSHHLSEDEIVFPYLRNKIDAPFDRLTSDHQIFSRTIDELDSHLPELKTGQTARVLELLGKMDELWEPHARIEEFWFTSEKLDGLAEKYEQEQMLKEISRHGQKNAGPGYLVLPFVLYTLDSAERIWVSADLPWFVRYIMLPVVWRNKWQAMKPFLNYYREN